MGLTKYILQRFVLTIPMVFILLSVVFLVLRLMPGKCKGLNFSLGFSREA